MDVTSADKPLFNWYRETIESDDRYLRHIWRAQDTSPPSGAVHDAEPNVATIDRNAGNYWTDLYNNPDDHPYEQLGFNPPKPYFSVARMGSNGQTTYTYQNLVALAGGMQNELDPESRNNGDILYDNGTMGAALYLADPDASLHKGQKSGCVRVFNSGSLRDVSREWRIGSEVRGSNPYMGMVNSEPVFLATQQGDHADYVASGVFFSDNRGGIFYVTFEDPETKAPYDSPDKWNIYPIASLRGSGDNTTAGYSIPLGLATGGSSGTQYMSGGTANALRADPPKTDSPDEDTQHLLNKSQMIFAFAMPNIAAVPAEGGKMSIRDEWARLNAENDTVSTTGELEKGWYIPLQGDDAAYHEEYVTTRPVISGGNMYVATFMQERIDAASPGICGTGGSFMGKSRLYAISLESGGAVLWGDRTRKYIELDGVKIVSATETGSGIEFGIAELDPNRARTSMNSINEASVSYNGNTGQINVEPPDDGSSVGGSSSLVAPNDSIINWHYNK
jgi:hypothetical protein